MIASAADFANGVFQLTLAGEAGINHRIEASTDLVNWIPVTTLTNFTGKGQINDSVSAKERWRFFRALAIAR